MKPLVFTLLLISTTAFGADGIVQTVNGTTVAGGTVKTTQTNVIQMNWDSVIRAGDLGSPNAGGYIRWSGTNVNTQIYSGDNSDLLFTSDGNKYYFTGGVPLIGNGSGLTNIPYAGVKGQLWVTNAVDGSIQNVYTNAPFGFAVKVNSGLLVNYSDGTALLAADDPDDVEINGISLTVSRADQSNLAVFNVPVTVAFGISGDGSLLTSINASQLTSGTVPTARLDTLLNQYPAALTNKDTRGLTLVGSVSSTNGYASFINNKAAPSSISVTASVFNYTNTLTVNIQVFLDANGANTAVTFNGTAIFSALVGGDHTIILQPGDRIGVTYSVATPIMKYREF